MSRTVRTLAVLALTVLFLTSPVTAAAAALSNEPGASLWGSAWQWLVELLLPDGPNDGEERPAPGPNGDDAGGTIDPNGLTVSGVTPEPRGEVRPDR